MTKHFGVMAGLLLLAACSGQQSEAPKPQSPVVAESFKVLGDDEVLSRVSALPPQELDAGTCGLFLWLKREDAPLFFFQRSDNPSAAMILDGERQTLPRTGTETLIAFNFYEKQTFSNGGFELTVNTKAEEVRTIRQGVKLETASVSLTTSDGWSAVLPAAGIIGCKY